MASVYTHQVLAEDFSSQKRDPTHRLLVKARHVHGESKETKSRQEEILACVGVEAADLTMISLKKQKPVEGGTGCTGNAKLVTGELSGGSRSGVRGEQKLGKPHTERGRGTWTQY